jgi:hypothetical protein
MNITYWLKDAPPVATAGVKPAPDDRNELKLEIFDSGGTLVRTLRSIPKASRFPPDDPDEPQKPEEPALTKKQGLNRVQWDLRYEGARRLDRVKLDAGDPEQGPLALPGLYTLKLTVAGDVLSAEGEIAADPRSTATAADLQANFEFTMQVRAVLDRLAQDIECVRAIRTQAEEILSRTADLPASHELQATAKLLIERSDAIERQLHNPEAEVVYDVLTGLGGGAKLYSQFAPLYSEMQASDFPPTQGQLGQMQENLAGLASSEAELTALLDSYLPKLEAQAGMLGLPHIIVPSWKPAR